MTLEELKIIITAQTSQFTDQINKVKREVGGMSTDIQAKMKTIGGSMQRTGGLMSVAFTTPIVAGFAACIKAASDYNETVSKIGVVFGDTLTPEVMKWSKNSLAQFGMAQTTALDMAALYGDMGTSMGQSQGDSSVMSMDLAGRAADVSSFKNISLDQAKTAMAGIYTGETESLKQLGVIMTQTQLDAYAMANGYGKVTKDMTEAEKVGLRFAFVMDATSNAQGDFARTGGGAAGQMKTFQETMKELAVTFGQEVLPTFTPILTKINHWMKAFGKLDGGTKKTILIVAGLVAGLGPLLVIIGTIISACSVIGGAIALVSAPMIGIVAGIAAVIYAGFLLWKNWDAIVAKAKEVGAAIKNFFKGLKIKLPHIDMPHFKITWSTEGFWAKAGKLLGLPGKPTLGVKWFAEGGIFNGPRVIGVGEAGQEAVLPINKLDGIMARSLQKIGGSLNNGGGIMVHSGTVTVRGVNNQNELIGVTDLLMKKLAREQRRNK